MSQTKYPKVAQVFNIGHFRFLQGRLKTATLRHDEDGQATLINCLLRSYLSESLTDMAGKLVDKVTFPESASNNEWARYFYYLGKFKGLSIFGILCSRLQVCLFSLYQSVAT